MEKDPKNFVVLPINYEYNDNTYDDRGIDPNKAPFSVYTLEQAMALHKEKTLETLGEVRITQIISLEFLNNLLDAINCEHVDRTEGWDFVFDMDALNDTDKHELYKVAKDAFYFIEGIALNEAIQKTRKADGTTYNVSLKRFGSLVHVHDDMKYAVSWSFKDKGKLYEGGTHYLESTEVDEDEFKAEARKYKIEKIL